jgi:hypothetical protein
MDSQHVSTITNGSTNVMPESVNDEITNARERLKSGDRLSDVVGVIQNKINASCSGKDTMLLRLGMARLLSSEKQEKMAAVQFEKILETIKDHNLTKWDHDLCLDALKTMYSVFKGNPDVRYKNKAPDVLAMIANINITEAIKL